MPFVTQILGADTDSEYLQIWGRWRGRASHHVPAKGENCANVMSGPSACVCSRPAPPSVCPFSHH